MANSEEDKDTPLQQSPELAKVTKFLRLAKYMNCLYSLV